MVLHAANGTDRRGQAALEVLCKEYWYPIYSFIRRQGRPHHEAEDLTQQFLARLLTNNRIDDARPERGRFRTFILTSLCNLMTDQWRHAQTAKRGGGQAPLSLDLAQAETRFANEPSDPSLTPDRAFDRNWGLEILERALNYLRADYESTGRGALFAALAPHIWSDGRGGTDDQVLNLPGMKPHALTMALHRLRNRLGLRLREEVAATVSDGADVDSELRQLIAAIGGDRPN